VIAFGIHIIVVEDRRVAYRFTHAIILCGLKRLTPDPARAQLATPGLVVPGPVLALVTYLCLGPVEQGGNVRPSLRIIFCLH